MEILNQINAFIKRHTNAYARDNTFIRIVKIKVKFVFAREEESEPERGQKNNNEKLFVQQYKYSLYNL